MVAPLDRVELRARGLPRVGDEPEGVSSEQLTTALTAAVERGGCVGMSVAIYDPIRIRIGPAPTGILRLVTDVMAVAAAAAAAELS